MESLSTLIDTSIDKALGQQPMPIAIEDESSFQMYESVVFTNSCGSSLDHGVLAVGYSTDSGTEVPSHSAEGEEGKV